MVYDPGPLAVLQAERHNPNHDSHGKFAPAPGGGATPLSGADAHGAALHKGPLSDTAHEAVNEYGSSGHRETNTMLRKNKGEISEDHGDRYSARVTRGMDEAMAGQSLPHDIVVTRGVASTHAMLGGHEPAVGLTYVDHGFVSTSTAPGTYHLTGITPGGAQLRITAPKGTKAFSVPNPVGYERPLLDRGEVVLNRGLTYRMTRVSEPDSYGVRHIDVEVVPS